MYCVAVIYINIFYLSEQCEAEFDPEEHVPDSFYKFEVEEFFF